MSAIVAPTQVWLMRCVTRCSNQIGINMYHYLVGLATGGPVQDTEFALQMDGIAAPVYKALLSLIDAQYYGLDVRRVFPLPQSVPASSTANTGAGTINSDTMAKQASGIITRSANFAGRKFRGRIYVPFPTEADTVSPGAPTASYKTRMDALAAALSAPQLIVGAGGTVQLSPVLLHPGGTTDTIVANLSRSKWGTQKRRGDYGRPNELPF